MMLCSVSTLPVAALAYTPEQQQACTGDVFRLCSSEIPDVDRITGCMIRNKTQLSAECRAQFEPTPGAAVRADGPPARLPGSKVVAKCKAASAKSHKSKRPAKHVTSRSRPVASQPAPTLVHAG
jgi:hypothetical protein